MSNILLWKELAARHERLRESSKKKKKKREEKNWSKAQTGLGWEPGEWGRAEPAATAPDLSRERLLSLHFSTKLVLAAAGTGGRWLRARELHPLWEHPLVPIPSAQSWSCTQTLSQSCPRAQRGSGAPPALLGSSAPQNPSPFLESCSDTGTGLFLSQQIFKSPPLDNPSPR